jgi:hypothetical protein
MQTPQSRPSDENVLENVDSYRAQTLVIVLMFVEFDKNPTSNGNKVFRKRFISFIMITILATAFQMSQVK